MRKCEIVTLIMHNTSRNRVMVILWVMFRMLGSELMLGLGFGLVWCSSSSISLNGLSVFKKRFRLDIRKFVFSNRAVNDWNALSSQCVNSCTVNTFKHILSAELEPETAKLYYGM